MLLKNKPPYRKMKRRHHRGPLLRLLPPSRPSSSSSSSCFRPRCQLPNAYRHLQCRRTVYIHAKAKKLALVAISVAAELTLICSIKNTQKKKNVTESFTLCTMELFHIFWAESIFCSGNPTRNQHKYSSNKNNLKCYWTNFILFIYYFYFIIVVGY